MKHIRARGQGEADDLSDHSESTSSPSPIPAPQAQQPPAGAWALGLERPASSAAGDAAHADFIEEVRPGEAEADEEHVKERMRLRLSRSLVAHAASNVDTPRPPDDLRQAPSVAPTARGMTIAEDDAEELLSVCGTEREEAQDPEPSPVAERSPPRGGSSVKPPGHPARPPERAFERGGEGGEERPAGRERPRSSSHDPVELFGAGAEDAPGAEDPRELRRAREAAAAAHAASEARRAAEAARRAPARTLEDEEEEEEEDELIRTALLRRQQAAVAAAAAAAAAASAAQSLPGRTRKRAPRAFAGAGGCGEPSGGEPAGAVGSHAASQAALERRQEFLLGLEASTADLEAIMSYLYGGEAPGRPPSTPGRPAPPGPALGRPGSSLSAGGRRPSTGSIASLERALAGA
eukprot:tig00021244_g19596.t2